MVPPPSIWYNVDFAALWAIISKSRPMKLRVNRKKQRGEVRPKIEKLILSSLLPLLSSPYFLTPSHISPLMYCSPQASSFARGKWKGNRIPVGFCVFCVLWPGCLAFFTLTFYFGYITSARNIFVLYINNL